MAEKPCAFPDVTWATEVSRDHIELTSNHTWEFGHHLDMIGVGDYVLVHVGFAISVIDAAEAARIFDYLSEIGELGEEGADAP